MFVQVLSKQEVPNFLKALSVVSEITQNYRVLRVSHDY